ncbi:hypothetical protein N7466_005421 [Penicillium verhagenii]|uniref:uncharacterized protein n=1 Tax=Penicillium verhagenii TaxID=1562060 RepID=UPI00254547FF|nr:uncharacterized protein N7466_005421 [Penicillium verhagenii]KAJ5929928.1 hypothetical protein N7466_005421 [Penicillium verhagenii]
MKAKNLREVDHRKQKRTRHDPNASHNAVKPSSTEISPAVTFAAALNTQKESVEKDSNLEGLEEFEINTNL